MVKEDDRVSNVNNSCGKEDDQTDKNRIVISNEDTFMKSSDTENKSDHAKIELGKTSAECKQISMNKNGERNVTRVYTDRWWMLSTVLLLNFANYSHWVAFASVTKNSAKYYDQTGDRIDLITIVSYALGIPCCILSAYAVETWGLKISLKFGGIMTGLGGGLCCMSSFPYIWDSSGTPKGDARFFMALFGQAITGVACPFVSSVPTKISQHWFGENERTLATTLMSMSSALGEIIALGLTPLMVPTPDYIALMNIVWFIPAALGFVLCMYKVKSDHPPTPPSASAALEIRSSNERRRGASNLQRWMNSIKELATNKYFVLMFFVVGCFLGYNSAVITKMEQLLCARGYSDQVAGFASSSYLFSGCIAALPVSIVASKIKKSLQISKMLLVVGILAAGALAYLVTVPNQPAMLITFCLITGIFTISVFPTLLELIVECTYPTDQATSTALIYFSSSLQGVALMGAENALYRPLSEQEMEIQTCSEKGDTSHETAKDYSPYAIFITTYAAVFVVLYILFFHPEMKRTNADKNLLLKGDNDANITVSTSTNESEKLCRQESNIRGPIEEISPKDSSHPLLSVSLTQQNQSENVSGSKFDESSAIDS